MARPGSANDGLDHLATPILLASAAEGLIPDLDKVLTGQVRRPNVPEDWAYRRLRPVSTGAGVMEARSVWHQGHGCREWIRCDHGTLPRFIWKDEHAKTHRAGPRT